MRPHYETYCAGLVQKTKAYINSNGGWRDFYALGRRKGLQTILKDEVKELGLIGLVTAVLRHGAGYGDVIRTHGNGAYFLHYAYIGQPHGPLDLLFTRTGVTKGACNRLPHIVEMVREEYEKHDKKSPFTISNLGGGFGFLDNIIADTCSNVKIRISDINGDVLRKGKGITTLNGASDRIEFIEMEAIEYVESYEPCDIVITMGIIDYLVREDVIAFLQRIKQGIKDKGHLILTAVGPTKMSGIAAKFGLRPLYKTRDEVHGILQECGFREIYAFVESTGTNTIAKARK